MCYLCVTKRRAVSDWPDLYSCMKKTGLLRIAFLCALVSVLAAACSRDDKTGGRRRLLDCCGNDFDVLISADPTALAASAGSDGLQKLNELDRNVFGVIINGEGLDKDALVSVHYSNPRMSAMLMCVADDGKLEESLGRMGWRHGEAGGMDVYSLAGEPHRLVVGGDVLWVVRRPDDAGAVEAVGALKARGRGLKLWLRERLAGPDCPLAGAIAATDSVYYCGELTLDGSAGRVTFDRLGADGNPAPICAAAGRRDASAGLLGALDPDATVMLALNLPDGIDLPSMFDRATGGMYLDNDLREAVAALDGRLGLSLSMADPASRDFFDMQNYSGAIVLGSRSGGAAVLAARLGAGLGAYGVPARRTVSGFDIALGGTTLLGSHLADDSTLVISTPRYAPSARVSDFGQSVAALRVNLPADTPLGSMLGLEGCGLQANINIGSESGYVDIDFTGSRRGFMSNLIDVLSVFD